MNGVLVYLLDIAQFVPKAEYDRLIEKYVAHIKSSRRMDGFSEILMPGEIEHRRRQSRESEGVPVPDETWRQIRELASRLNVSLDGIDS